MVRTPWTTYLWPGLPQLWRQGWFGLAIALGFAGLVNVALAGSLLWSELFAEGVRTWVWAAVGVTWALAALVAYRKEGSPSQTGEPPPAQDVFPVVLDHYLKGNWFEAEQMLAILLRENPRDVDAGLMLATLFRHTGRPDEAARQLDRLERLENASKWELEIGRERELIREARASGSDGQSPPVDEPSVSPPTTVIDAA